MSEEEPVPCPIPAVSVAPTNHPLPALTIHFPFEHAPFDRDTIGISGRIDHDDLAGVSVAACIGDIGVLGSIAADGRFLIDDLPVASSGATFTIEIEAADEDGSAVRRSLILEREPVLTSVPALVLDESRNRLVGVDTYSRALYGISLSTYRRELISTAAERPLAVSKPVAVAHDPVADVYYVADDNLDALVSVRPEDGASMIVADRDIGSGPNLLTPTDVVYDANRKRVLVTDDGRKALLAVDPSSGDRTIVSGPDIGVGPEPHSFTAMGLDEYRDRVIVVSGTNDEIYAIDLSSGDRELLSDRSHESPETSRSFSGITVASAAGVAYLADDFSNAVVRLDLFSGLRESISSSGLATSSPLISHPVIGQGPLLEWPSDVVLDPVANRLFVTDHDFAQPLIEIDESNGDRQLLGNSSVGTGVNFRDLVGIHLAAQSDLAYVADFTADVIALVDLRTGNRKLIEGPANGRGTIDTAPLAIAIDEAEGVAYVVDFTTSTLYSLELDTGTRTTVSDASRGDGPPLARPFDIELDAESGRIFVLDRVLDALLAVDVATGDRVSLGAGAEGIALDLENERLFVVAIGGDEIHAIDLASGSRSIVSSKSVGFGSEFRHAADLALDTINDRLIVIDKLRGDVFSVDITTGDRRIISGDASLLLLVDSDLQTVPRIIGGGPPLARPERIVVDSERQVAYVTDSLYDAIVSLDLSTGYRQIIAK